LFDGGYVQPGVLGEVVEGDAGTTGGDHGLVQARYAGGEPDLTGLAEAMAKARTVSASRF
jgi:hypothetical protein